MEKLSFDELIKDGLDEYVLSLIIANYDAEGRRVRYYKPADKVLLFEAYNNNQLDKYIKAPMVNAFKSLLDNNISVSKVETSNSSVTLTLHDLNKSNKMKFRYLVRQYPDNYILDNNVAQIKVKKNSSNDESYGEELDSLVKVFKLQDITSGYMDEEEFLMNICNCEKVEGLKENADNTNVKITFDENKKEKSFKEYLQEYKFEDLYIPSENRIYNSKYCLDAHQRYLDNK
jgi:hypothetical protein